jgi:glycosyltransferase involved in cell wall biosynthesis
MSLRVSVIVPLYNKAAWIERCLDSIARQSYRDFEVIVVDDGSTDGGERKIPARAGNGSVRLIQQANAGPGAARNRGVREAQGDLIAMLDADDAWHPEYLTESVRILDGHGDAVACLTWAMMEFPARLSTIKRWERIGIPKGRYRVTPRTPLSLLLGIVSNMLPSSTVIRRNVFESQNGFYARTRCLFAEDAYLWLKVLLHHEVAFDGRALVDRYCDASELAMNIQGARPVEPFLLDGEEIKESCPPELGSLLRRFLAARACKTASVYGYFGRYREARTLVREFVSAGDWRVPFFPLALVGCTPAAKWLGYAARAAKLNLRESNS